MNKEQLLALGLNDEQVAKVLEGFKGFVPPTRFNEVNEAKKNAEALLAERDTQLAELKKGIGANEELQKQIETLQLENQKANEKYQADIKQLQISNIVERELMGAGAKNLKAVKALLNLDNAELDGESIKGLADQIKGLQKSDGFLFNQKTDNEALPSGTKPAEGKPAGGNKPVSEMNYSERVAFLNAGGKLN